MHFLSKDSTKDLAFKTKDKTKELQILWLMNMFYKLYSIYTGSA